MKLSQLVYFEAVCRHKNFSKAAEEIFVSQPAISTAVRELEDEFSVKLFTRNGNRLVLTEAGEHLLIRTREILKKTEMLTREMKELSNQATTIKIGTPPMIGTILFPTLYTSFREQYPKINIEIFEYGSLRARGMVADGTADAAIAILDEIIEDDLDTFTLFTTELVFCVSKGHPLANKKQISLSDLHQQKVILMKEDSYQSIVLKGIFADNKIEPIVLLTSSQLQTIKNFIVSYEVGAFLFKEIADRDPDIVSLRMDKPIRLNIGIVGKNSGSSLKNVRTFINFVKKYNIEN